MLCLDAAYCPWIRSAGHALRPRPWSFPRRVLSDYLLIQVSEGQEWVALGSGQRQELKAGDAYLLPPGVVTNKGCDAWSHPYWVHFDLIYNPQREQAPLAPCDQAYLDTARESWLQPSPREIYGCDFPLLIPAALLPRIKQDIVRIVEAWRSVELTQRLRSHQLLADFMLVLVEHLRGSLQHADSEAVLQHAERIALASLDADFGVAAFAAAAGLSLSRFHDAYKQWRGITPLAFLSNARMQRARELLRDTSLSIGSIAALVGHPDPTVFGRSFKRVHKCSPREWRKQNV